MAELNDREKKLVLIKYVIHGVSPFSEAPLETRVNMLRASMKFLGLEYVESEMLDLGEAILDLQKRSSETMLGFLHKNPDLVRQAIENANMGNDKI